MACKTFSLFVKSVIRWLVPPRVAPSVLSGSVCVFSVALLLGFRSGSTFGGTVRVGLGSIDDDMGLDSISCASSVVVSASGINRVDDRVGKCWVANDGQVVHEPYAYEDAVWVDVVVGVASVALDHVIASCKCCKL